PIWRSSETGSAAVSSGWASKNDSTAPRRSVVGRSARDNHERPNRAPALVHPTISASNVICRVPARDGPAVPPGPIDCVTVRDTAAESRPSTPITHTPTNSPDAGAAGVYHGASVIVYGSSL